MRMMKVVVVWVALVTSMYGISQGIRPSGGKSMGMANASVCTRDVWAYHNNPGANGIIDLVSVFQRNYRFNFRFEISNKIHLKSRIEYLTIHKKNAPTESGMLIVQDILYRPKSSPIHLALRYALFDTESYNSRIYSFENNALYVFSVPANY